MKQLKDYLHLYLGCPIVTSKNKVIETLRADDLNRAINQKWRPILRPLSDITEEEKIEMGYPNTSFAYVFGGVPEAMVLKPHEFLYLLSKHFDLLNLHETGLCYYKNEKWELY